jgi:glutathione S-transferase
MCPALELDDGAVLTENIAVLAYLADRAGQMGGGSGMERWRVIEATAFISSEIHKNFSPFFKPDTTDAAKAKATEALSARFGLIAEQLGGREFLIGDTITVADCYLFVMLMWAGKMGVTLPEPLPAYAERLGALPAVQQALQEEGLA